MLNNKKNKIISYHNKTCVCLLSFLFVFFTFLNSAHAQENNQDACQPKKTEVSFRETLINDTNFNESLIGGNQNLFPGTYGTIDIKEARTIGGIRDGFKLKLNRKKIKFIEDKNKIVAELHKIFIKKQQTEYGKKACETTTSCTLDLEKGDSGLVDETSFTDSIKVKLSGLANTKDGKDYPNFDQLLVTAKAQVEFSCRKKTCEEYDYSSCPTSECMVSDNICKGKGEDNNPPDFLSAIRKTGGKATMFKEQIGKTSQTQTLDTVAGLLNFGLMFSGIVIMLFILYSGYLFLTAMGNKDKITKAREIIINTIIGLVIISSAYIVTNYVINTSKKAADKAGNKSELLVECSGYEREKDCNENSNCLWKNSKCLEK